MSPVVDIRVLICAYIDDFDFMVVYCDCCRIGCGETIESHIYQFLKFSTQISHPNYVAEADHRLTKAKPDFQRARFRTCSSSHYKIFNLKNTIQ